jgi:hypothetical protein
MDVPLDQLRPGDLVDGGGRDPAVYLGSAPHPLTASTVLTLWSTSGESGIRTVPMGVRSTVHRVTGADDKKRRARLRTWSRYARAA